MKNIRIALLYEPGTSHIGPITMQAEEAMSTGVISSIPTISIVESYSRKRKNVINIACDDKDYPFWLAFYHGISYARNNREIVCGGR